MTSILMVIFRAWCHSGILPYSKSFVIKEGLMLLRSLNYHSIQVSTFLYYAINFIILSVLIRIIFFMFVQYLLYHRFKNY